MPKIKPVMAWGIVYNGRLSPWTRGNKDAAKQFARPEDGEKVVRVRICVVPKAKRKVKK